MLEQGQVFGCGVGTVFYRHLLLVSSTVHLEPLIYMSVMNSSNFIESCMCILSFFLPDFQQLVIGKDLE